MSDKVLTEDQLVSLAFKHGLGKELTFESGPYDVDNATVSYCNLADEIIAYIRAQDRYDLIKQDLTDGVRADERARFKEEVVEAANKLDKWMSAKPNDMENYEVISSYELKKAIEEL